MGAETRMRRTWRAGAALLVCATLLGSVPAAGEEPPEPPRVDWQDWSDALFARARQENRSVLLTVVTPWCNSCENADREVYQDPIVRHLIARSWIPVRVDAMDRPDIDSRYRVALWVLSQQTGYPVTGFLFPTGEAIWVEGFIPAQDRERRVGLRALLAQMDHHRKTEFDRARQNAFAVQKAFDGEAQTRSNAMLDDLLVSSITDAVVSQNDPENGGYGRPPRRQNSFMSELVLLAARRRADPGLERQAVDALHAAVRGAMFDRLNGGFHVAAVDRQWSVPVFEKLLAVNAVYLHALVQAVRATGDEELAEAARSTVDYILGTLATKQGALLAMQAPAPPGEDETSFYSWTVEEVRGALDPASLPWAEALFGFKEQGEVVLGLPPRFTLKTPPDVREALAEAGLDPQLADRREEEIVAVLARLREGRKAPPVLEREYLDSSAMAISALLQAGATLSRDDASGAALAALDRILGVASIKEGLPHRLDRPQGSPVLMIDQACLGLALIDAYELTGEERYLKAAEQVAKTLVELFADSDGAFFDVVEQPDAAGYVRIRRKPFPDTVLPSPQVMAGRLLERVGRHTDDPKLIERALAAYLWTARRIPPRDMAEASLALAVDATLNGPVRILVHGKGPEALEMRREAASLFEPARVILGAPGGRDGPARLSICLHDHCKDEITTRTGLEDALEGLRSEARARGRLRSAP